MRTDFFLDNLIDETPPFSTTLVPNPTDYSYYKAQTSFWYLSTQSNMEESPQVDLTQTCTENETITSDTIHKTLWFYRSDSQELLIPIKNAQAILNYLYRALPLGISRDAAQAWLRTLEFSKRHKHTRTEYLYKGVTFEDCEPLVKGAERCVVLDMSQPDRADLTQEEIWEMQDRAKDNDTEFAKPHRLKERRAVLTSLTQPQLDRLTAQSGHTKTDAHKLNTSRSRSARYQHLLRLKKKFGANTPEYEEAVALYDRGERRPTGRPLENNQLRQKVQLKVCGYIRELANPEVNLFYGDLISVRGEGTLRASEAPIVDQRGLLTPMRFHADNVQADYDYDKSPLGWVLTSREVRVPQGTNQQGDTYYAVKTQVTRVALLESALQTRMANYSQAYHYVTTGREKNPVTGYNEMCAIFDIEYTNSGKLRTKRPTRGAPVQDQIISTQAQLDALSTNVDKLAAKVDKLGKAFHALMGIIKTMEERVS